MEVVSRHGRAAQPTDEEWARIADTFRWGNRERQVVRLVLTGVPRKVAARRLAIGLSTLQTYLRRAVRKAGADDVVGLLWRVVALRDRARERSAALRPRDMVG